MALQSEYAGNYISRGFISDEIWDDETLGFALSNDRDWSFLTVGLSQERGNACFSNHDKLKPAVPRRLLTPDRIVEIGTACLEMKNNTQEKINTYRGREYAEHPISAFVYSGTKFDNTEYTHPFNVAHFFALHIQEIDPLGYAGYIDQISSQSRSSYAEQLIEDCRVPPAYRNADLAILALQKEREAGKNSYYFSSDRFLEIFSPEIFTSDLFDYVAKLSPVFFIKRSQEDRRELEIQPQLRRFVTQDHMQAALNCDENVILFSQESINDLALKL